MIEGEEFQAWLRTRRSVREFDDRAIPREVLERLMQAAITAPSNTNRQPWRFSVVSDPTTKQRLVDAVRERTVEMRTIIDNSHHAEEFKGYGDFFHEPLDNAAAVIIPQYREYPDLIANLIRSGGGDPGEFHTAASMQAELCSTAGAVMCLLLQAKAEGLGACWMAGPMVARDQIHEILGVRRPWQMVGGIALGYPIEHPETKPRKPLDAVVDWITEDEIG
jgi:nitroreductase